ncbi:MerR family transcriptional regulator [Fictibacillus iocasae]|uniref:Chromosome-anchoring protein RacA n=1 Tax=Fictibacillus iocasae TaxID=2715437 RepID=A0ABW2NL78_9BACL
MEMILKTKSVSEELGVNPTTVQRWVRHFNMDLKKNDHGHYLFTEQDIQELKEIKGKLDSGLLIGDIQLSQSAKPARSKWEGDDSGIEMKFDALLARIDTLEKKLEEKADSVVSYQILQHAGEMEEMVKRLAAIEARLEDAEVSLLKMPVRQEKIIHSEKTRKNWFVSLFTL